MQLITIGPVIDLYGRFAALKLDKMMIAYPRRVCSKPIFTQLPPCVFSGAEFALIPSRDEPFGLVAVEFGRKGALGVGSRVGGLGQMPGWWYTVESTTTTHLLKQFKNAIRSALSSKTKVRAMMRARSSLQRFPVAQWVEDLETLQSTAMKIHLKEATRKNRNASRLSLFQKGDPSQQVVITSQPIDESEGTMTTITTPSVSRAPSQWQSRAPSPVAEERHSGSTTDNSEGVDQEMNSAAKSGPEIQSRKRSITHLPRNSSITSLKSLRRGLPPLPTTSAASTSRIDEVTENPSIDGTLAGNEGDSRDREPGENSSPTGSLRVIDPNNPFQTPVISRASSPGPSCTCCPGCLNHNSIKKSGSLLSLASIMAEQKKFELQNVDPFFTDSNSSYYKSFSKMLDVVNAKTSEDQLCIERFLIKSERKWFDQRHNVKVNYSATSTPATSVFRSPRSDNDQSNSSRDGSIIAANTPDEFLLGDDFVAPTGLRKFFQRKIGDWQIYSFLLAFVSLSISCAPNYCNTNSYHQGQIIAANSYQITLITGEIGQTAEKLYVIASIYLAASIAWWMVFRRMKSVFVLATPFALYGMAFFLLGMAPYVASISGRGWVYNVATALYAIASASGSFFFALNFGDEGWSPAEPLIEKLMLIIIGGAPVAAWVFRACVIQGTQQIYVALLWYWGSSLTSLSSTGVPTTSLITSTPIVTAITTPIAVLMWVIGVLLYLGLPNYYRQKPGKVPSFYRSLLRRRIVLVR